METLTHRIQNFVDYFVICGFNLNVGLEPEISSDGSLHVSPLDRGYKCHVINNYPKSVSWNPLDKDAICLLSLPNGLRFRTQNHNLGSQFHSFVITKQNGQRYYGSSLVFYEKAHKNACHAIQTLQVMHLAETSNNNRRTFERNCNSRSLPRHFKVTEPQKLSSDYYDDSNDVLFVTKCLVLISQYPFVRSCSLFLSSLYMSWKERKPILLENFILYLIDKVKVPAPGYSLSFYINMESKVSIRYPNLNELPLCDFPIRKLFHLLDIDTLLHLFTSALLEKQILICSSNYQDLMIVAECLNCLIFPFEWPHVYVPILPSSLKHFLDAPVPYIMGISRNTNVNVNLTTEANICFVNLERKTFQFPEDLLHFPNRLDFASEIIDLLDQFNIPTRSFYRLDKSAEIHLKSKRSGSLTNVSLSNEKLVYQQSSEDILKNDCDDLSDGSFYNCSMDDYISDQRFNNAIRELFLNKFLHLFISYENSIIKPNQGHEEWINNKENVCNFNKTKFLSEHTENYEFLSQFIETQMFTNFMDAKIQSYWLEKSSKLQLFDNRIHSLKVKHFEAGLFGCSFENCSNNIEWQTHFKEKYMHVDYKIPPPDMVESSIGRQISNEIFPQLSFTVHEIGDDNGKLFSVGHVDTDVMTRTGGEVHPSAFGERLTVIKTSDILPQVDGGPSPAVIAQKNWNFVEKLLTDCKIRTKKMLVAKIGSEAIQLGHGLPNTQIEENAHIYGLCDLLERIWSHGLRNKRSKSAIWWHLLQYRSDFEITASNQTIHYNEQTERDKEVSFSLLNDIKYVEKMTDIKTHVGLTKAWMRLSLEKKHLSRHLRNLLSNSTLLRLMYKRSAFLRCEEEKEQFLFHLLSLNAVDYFCFTNTYVNCVIPYRVIIKTCTKISHTINGWIVVSGQIGETEKISIPDNQFDFVFHNKNLGLLSLLRIGLENGNAIRKWLLDTIFVRNEITGNMYSFTCKRWLGHGGDDDSSERLLIGKRVVGIKDVTIKKHHLDVARIRSPSMPPPMKAALSDGEIQRNLSECANDVIKYYYSKSKENISMATLLCGENGLVYHIEQVFIFGFRSTRLFGRNLHIWDFIIRVREEYEECLSDVEDKDIFYFYELVNEIQNARNTLGKDGCFQVFVCISLRDHSINSIMKILSESKFAKEMFEEHSFFRKKSLFYFLTHLLDSLYDLDFVLENSLTLGISIKQFN